MSASNAAAGPSGPPPSAQLVVVPVVSCPTTFGTSDHTEPWHPSKLPALLTKSDAAKLVFYSDGFFTVLGPKGWACQGQIGADGREVFRVVPPGKDPSAAPTSPGDSERITAVDDSTGHGPGADVICPYFPNSPAAHFYGNEPPPPAGLACPPLREGTKVTYLTPDVARIQGPASTVGIAIYPQVTPPPVGGVNVRLEYCTLKGKIKALCNPILADFVVRRYPTVSPNTSSNP